ncbi:DUF4848 domain-containing protein [Chitinophaga sp. Mgbs1]|uniref:DUF4848 domain-containing protein n=1 Tax=Chitinophaga solisilvae TaxID=1233460 RepID=A0A433WDD0_9BACT|nr:DUF4848 domain-containing protein [Chitinophaga solisilvae]
MTFKLAMTATMMALITFVSCKKDIITTQPDSSPASTPKLKVENGIIHFKDNQEFIQTMLVINSLPAPQRAAWEKSTGFASLRSKYEELNRELNKMEDIRDAAGFYAVRDKYRNIAVWYADSSYQINCSGIMESSVVNADGHVRVGDNLLSFREDMIKSTPVSADKNARGTGTETVIWKKSHKGSYRQEYKSQLSRTNTNKTIYGSAPPPASFSLSQGTITQDAGTNIYGYVQYRLWNASINNQNMGFVSVHLWVEYRNFLGIMRRGETTGLGHSYVNQNVVLSVDGYKYLSEPLYTSGGWPIGSTIWAIGKNWQNSTSEDAEIVAIASSGLKNNSVPTLGLLSAQFNFADQFLTESGAPNNYWARYEPFATSASFGFNISVQYSAKVNLIGHNGPYNFTTEYK